MSRRWVVVLALFLGGRLWAQGDAASSAFAEGKALGAGSIDSAFQAIGNGTGAETVVDYSLRFQSEFGPGTWVCGYTDDMIAYIPSRRVWEEGGYEGGYNLYEYGRPAFRWAGDVEQRIADSVHRLVKQVRSRP